MTDRVKYWFEQCEYDIESAKVMFKSHRWLYVVFFCHLTIEKALKAYYELKENKIPPYIHNLRLLAEQSGIYELFSETQKDFIDKIQPMNIQARYPSYKDEMYKTLNLDICNNLISETEEMVKWIKKQ
jgi:HEPN domain-containing protein